MLDLSHSEIPAQIQENLIAYMRLFAGLPDMVMHDAEDFWLISNKPAPGNTILKARWSAEHIEEQIDNTFDHIGQHTEHIDWMVFPGDQPADLNQRLEARGMPGGPAGNWLWADLSTLNTEPAMPDSFRIERVQNDQKLAEWGRISEEGFGEELSCFNDAYARHGYGPEAFSIHYIGYSNDTPVTSGTLLDAGGTASLYDISTPPAFRQQGFGGALTNALMREIRNGGYASTWIWSSNMAKSVYQKLGYVDADFGIREHTWQKT